MKKYGLLGGALLVALAVALMAGLIGNPMAFAGAEEPYPYEEVKPIDWPERDVEKERIDLGRFKAIDEADQPESFPLGDILDGIHIKDTIDWPERDMEKERIDPGRFKGIDKEGEVKEVTPDTYSFSGSLAPGYGRLHGRFVWSEGHEVRIWGSWAPGDQVFLVGIFDVTTGVGYGFHFSDGAFSRNFTVPWPSNEWAILVGNLSPPNTETIFYHGHLR